MRPTTRTTALLAAAAAAVVIPLGTPAVAFADETAAGSSQTADRGATTHSEGAAKPSKLTPPKINLPKPPKINLPKPPKPYPDPPQARELPVIPDLGPHAPRILKRVARGINRFVYKHPAPGTYWVDKDGNPI
ncbi:MULTISPECIES: hypothetical protein [Mycolicibacterium]|uniref:hypothetical protein n=1 Tax=Mycolicibacterium TaxID=1866885 RepID=UPI001CDD4460|nr:MULTISPECIES: hypothetical protein [Mycolicibacterium]MCC9181069.1 hypothetical protein [Mycolicibacterium mageritense]UBV14788.1 hypothetical protein H8Z57_29510 [Mycolicibacterium fortuitum]